MPLQHDCQTAGCHFPDECRAASAELDAISSGSSSNLRGLSEDERWLLDHVCRWGSDGYPVSKVGSHHWTWGPVRSIQGPPTVFRTKREAIASFESYLDILRDAAAGRL